MDDEAPPPNETEIEYQLQLMEGDDPTNLVLVCSSNLPMEPIQYAHALISYAETILAAIEGNSIKLSSLN